MSRARDLLLDATMTFADRLYEALREELVAELAARRTASPTPKRGRLDGHAPVQKLDAPKKGRAPKPTTTKRAPPPAPSRKRAAAPPNTAASTREQAEALSRELVTFVKAHPGCRRRELRSITGCAEHTFVLAVAHARSSGAIRLDGERNAARYFPA